MLAAPAAIQIIPNATWAVSYTHLDVYKRQVFTHIFCGLEKFITIQTAFRVAHLRRNRYEMICMINAFPLFCFLRLSPAALSNWGFCIRNPFKYRILWNISRNPLNFLSLIHI